MSIEENEVDPILEQLYKLSKAAGMSQSDLAAELGYESGSSISGMLRGKQSPRLDLVHSWAALVGKKVVLVGENARVRKAEDKPSAPADPNQVTVVFDRYLAALAMGYLIVASHDVDNDAISDDLQKACDLIALAIGRR